MYVQADVRLNLFLLVYSDGKSNIITIIKKSRIMNFKLLRDEGHVSFIYCRVNSDYRRGLG